MGAPQVEDAAGGGEGVVLKIQASGFPGCCPHSGTQHSPRRPPSLLKERFFSRDQGHHKTFFPPPLRFLSGDCYSCRKASIGSKREARKAGIMPLTSPTAPRMSVDAISVPGAMIRRISPASPFLAKALYNVSLPTESATV